MGLRNIPYLLITPEGEIGRCNPASLLQLRVTEMQAIGRKIGDFLAAPDAEWLRTRISTLTKGHREKRLLCFVDASTSPFFS
jgi:hypothetical protein